MWYNIHTQGGDIMSIFKSVQAAEKKADGIKDEALTKVNELLEKVRQEAMAEADKIIKEAHKSAEVMQKETVKTIATLKQEIHKETVKQQEKIRSTAEKNLSETTKFIIDKVFSL